MRVISGKYKGYNLKGFDINGTRPTMQRVKESVFGIINPYILNKKVLDLFGGSGALGIEALSNGASACTFIDTNKIACDIIRYNTKKISGVNIIKMDSLKYLKETNETFDLIILDPPYDKNLIAPSIKIIEEKNLLNKDGMILCEYEKEEFTCSYEIWKEKKYGSKNIRIYKNN